MTDQASLQQFWVNSGGDDLLQQHSNFQSLFDSLINHDHSTQVDPSLPTTLVCIDDRIPGNSDLAPANYVHMAGEGILNPNAKSDLSNKIDSIRPHTGCGAKALYCKSNQIQTSDPDQICMGQVEQLAKEISSPDGDPVEVDSPLTKDKLAPIHCARVVYYDGTGKFDFSKVAGLPVGFIISRNLISDPTYAQSEVSVSIDIAQGEHGFGQLFTPQTPLYLVAVAPNQAQLIKLLSELKTVADQADNVVVDQIITHG